MQSSGQVKKITEYKIGERVYEGDYYAGRIVSIFVSGVSGYILLVNSKEEYTIYRGINNRCSLTLTRNIPEPVALQFAQAILGKEEMPMESKPVKKSPVERTPVQKTVAMVPSRRVMEKQESSSDSESSLYFDFV